MSEETLGTIEGLDVNEPLVIESKDDVIAEILRRLDSVEEGPVASLRDRMVDEIVNKYEHIPSDKVFVKYIEKNFGSILQTFPDLKAIHLGLVKDRQKQLKSQRRNKKRR